MDKNNFKSKFLFILALVSTLVLLGALLALYFADELASAIDVIGIRIATLIVAFAAFISSTVFSFLVYMHNRTVSQANEDANQRGELFRNLQFTSSNYSIIEFMDRMLIYVESERYINRFIKRRDPSFHMFDSTVLENEVFDAPTQYDYVSFKIPFKVIEGKLVSKITIEKLKFERGDFNFEFIASQSQKKTRAYILYNDQTKRNNIIVNLITKKDNGFFIPSQINVFTKIKITLNITSLLGVTTQGTSELYFVNPEQIEGDGTNTYRINSSNFVLKGMPFIDVDEHDLL